MQPQLKNLERPESYLLWWLDPRSKERFHAGMAFYYPETKDYVLRIDEEPLEKNYTLRTQSQFGDKIYYDLWLLIKNKQGNNLRKVIVGRGVLASQRDHCIHINYGSKFKTLLLDTDERT